jgi:hypothetical protein
VAVDVFKLVLTLKMASWEISKKVLLVSIQMQDMMSALFQCVARFCSERGH